MNAVTFILNVMQNDINDRLTKILYVIHIIGN